MKEKPIIFSTPMVRAILDGRKTMTRRLIVPQPDLNTYRYYFNDDWFERVAKWQEGDHLWVRETWATSCFDFKPDGSGGKNPLPTEPMRQSSFIYKANGTFNPVWKPSIHMPRKAARLFLEVTDVRVERLQEITEEDAEREGVNHRALLGPNAVMELKSTFENGFHILWDTLNAKRGYGWDVNPWVYVISFRRLGNEL